MQEPLYISWKEWNCRSDCRYYCMIRREQELRKLGLRPVKYHGKWPFIRISAFQEPVSAALSAMNLFVQFNGWLTFFFLLYYKLPLRPQTSRTYYEYTGLWHIYGFLSMNAWFWSAIFHSRDFELSEKLHCSSTVALIGYSLILTILRTFSVKNGASRVMVSAPLLAFLTTHILYLNFCELDYGLNMKVSVAMGVAQILLWGAWAFVTHHPSSFKLCTVLIGGSLGMLLDYYDFPPYKGYFDAHALWHAITIPLTFLWWSFIKDDAEFQTTTITKKMM
ncbi:post-GPI attachment to proteins factor 3-like [Iris pallida]|uniref:Post-GPI attachment to proteins factor 3 n=1 Tax=Iris pallida TaxID=29817 RepID=A0AAX6GXB0_IRIPA|nr:post-GPI attachment to proteins factor 3-like [Iris pallida]